MKVHLQPKFANGVKYLVLVVAVVATAILGLVSFKAEAQQEQYPDQVFLYNGQPWNEAFPPGQHGNHAENSSVTIKDSKSGITPVHDPGVGAGDPIYGAAYRDEAAKALTRLLGVSNPQPAILAATDASNRAVVYNDPGNTPGNQNLVNGLPAGARPHGVAYYGSDNALLSDFGNSRIHVVQISTATLLSTINTAPAGYDGTGTIAVAPNLSVALAMGGNNSLKVIQAPFGPGSTISSINLPGSIAAYQTQAIVFDNSGRAFVYHTAGISVLDAPYTSIAFTIPVSNSSSGAIGITPNGNTLLTTVVAGNQVRIFNAPFSSSSVAAILNIPGGNGLDGIMVAPDGNRAIVVSAFTRHAASIAAPFTSGSTVETLPLPAGSGTFEDVGISADSQLAILTGNNSTEQPVLVKAPFTAAGAVSAYLPINGVPNQGRGAGAVRFLPPGLAPGLTISKSAPATAGSGGSLTYTINYANTGQVNATNVVITDPLPANTSFVSATSGGTLSSGNVVWNIGTVNAGANGSVSFTVTVNAPSGSTVNNVNYTIQADGVSPIAGPPVSTEITNSAPTITAVPVSRVQGASGSATIANVNDAEDAENNLTVSVVGSSTVNGVTISGITVNAAGVVTANVAASCTASSANFTLQVTDSGNLSSTATLNVTVTPETTPPVINPIANVVATLPPNSMATSMPVSFPLPTATDNCSAVTVTTNPVSGSVFPVGTTTVNVTATDGNGNTATATFTVTVQYNFIGFGGRVMNPPAVNFAQAGNSLPITFSLSGFKGYNIFAPGSPSSQQINCMTGVPVGPSSPAAMPLGLYYFHDNYTMYWQTSSSWAGTCRRFSMTLADGTTRTLNFQFFN